MTLPEDDTIEWAGFRIPSAVAANHFCIMGAVGAGTSLTLNSLMASVLRQMVPDNDKRAVIFDAKGDLIEFLHKIKLSCPIYNLNPFDSCGLRWNIGADWTQPSLARHYAELLVPDPRDDFYQFFVDTARKLLAAVLIALMQAGPSWTLADLIDVTTDIDQLRQIILTGPNGDRIIQQHLSVPTTSMNVIHELGIAMQTFEGAADASKALSPDRGLAIREWSKSKSSILVLETVLEHEDALKPLYRLIFDTITQRKFDPSQSPSQARGADWYFLHDIDSLPRLDSLPKLLTDGRSFGARVAFSCQDHEYLKHLYGEKVGGQLPELCGNHSILRLLLDDTGKWAAELASKGDTFEIQRAAMNQRIIEVDLPNGFRNRKHFRTRSKCKPEDFLAFPIATQIAAQGIVTGCHVSQSLGGAVVRSTKYDLASER